MTIADTTDDMGRTTIQVSDELADELHERKERGDSYEDVIWRLIEEGDQSASQEPPESPHSRTERRDAPSPPPEQEAAESPQESVQEDAEDVLRSLDLSGSGSKYEARVETVLAFYEHLRDHPGERVSKGDLEDLVEECGLDVAYASFGSFWGNWVKKNESQGRDFNTLTQLPGVEMDGDDYVYTGESA